MENTTLGPEESAAYNRIRRGPTAYRLTHHISGAVDDWHTLWENARLSDWLAGEIRARYIAEIGSCGMDVVEDHYREIMEEANKLNLVFDVEEL